MKTNISSERTDKRKNYIATYFSQGKNITDFDLNAMMDDLRHNHEALIETGIAPSGSPDFGF